jgi:SAM-dependent methyltransferase
MSTQPLFEKYYLNRPDFADGTTQFHSLLRQYIRPAACILEIGPGPSNPTSEFLSSLGTVTGVDVSDELYGNPALASACTFDGVHLPFAESSFDACVSNYVLEHVAAPEAHFAEVARVLQPGGLYVFRTPNLWHYVTIGSRILPYGVHLRLANRLRGSHADAHGPYPTFYRCNRRRRIHALCESAGLQVVRLDAVEKEPSYGRLHRLLFYPMMAYERLVNSSSALRCFRANLFGVVQKSAGGQGSQRH